MTEGSSWEKVIPNFQEGDIITPFESVFQRIRDNDPGWDGGIGYGDNLECLASVKRKDNQAVGVYNQKGAQILPEEFDECRARIWHSGDFYVSAIKVKKQGLYGLYDEKGQVIVPTQYSSVEIQDYAVIVENQNGMYGVYSLQGKQIINCEYDYIQFWGSLDRGYGCAITCKNRIYGARTEDGAEMIPLKFGRIEREVMGSGGYIVSDATNRDIKGWYSRDGKSSIPCMFESLKFKGTYCNPYFEVQTPDGLKGIYSCDGKEIVPPKFKLLNSIGKYIIALIEDDKLSVYDWNGTCLCDTALLLESDNKV